MKTASVRELRNHYTRLLEWLDAGEEILITRRGESIARLVPERPRPQGRINWSASVAVTRSRPVKQRLGAKESANLIKQAGGKW